MRDLVFVGLLFFPSELSTQLTNDVFCHAPLSPLSSAMSQNKLPGIIGFPSSLSLTHTGLDTLTAFPSFFSYPAPSSSGGLNVHLSRFLFQFLLGYFRKILISKTDPDYGWLGMENGASSTCTKEDSSYIF